MKDIFSPEKTKLIQKYPTVFKDLDHLDFSCEDGWISLLDDLCESLEEELESVPKEIREDFYVVQIKEKFGALRFYTSICYPDLDDLISYAEKKSAKICEFCGASGELRKQGWLNTRCDQCEEEYLKKAIIGR
jgi:hypothetical protein